MNKHFVWIIEADINLVLKKSGISSTYIIPNSIMKVDESILNSNIWIIIRNKGNSLSAYLTAKKIERFTEGYNEGDYLLYVNIYSSFKISSYNSLLPDSNVNQINEIPLGITEISDETNKQLISFVLKSIQTKLLHPPKSIISKINTNYLPKSKRSIAKMVLGSVLQNCNLFEIWGSGTGNKLTPFVNIAHAILKEKLGTSADEYISYLKELDPLESLIKRDNNKEDLKSNGSLITPIVDTDFTEINIATIYARKFVATNIQIDLEASLAKTEVAEKLHQDMLRDICNFLKSINLTPYETTSIDLMIETQGIKFYEIKSTTDQNLLAQSAKGAFQLAYYAEALKNEYEEAKYALIIHKTNNNETEKQCLLALSRLGITCLLYDPSCPWPDRIQNFLHI